MNDLQSSFSECLAWWALTFFIGIAFREFSRDAVGRWIGRASVATSCFVLISFCQFATHQCQVQYQITAAKPAKEISSVTQKENQIAETNTGEGRAFVTAAGHVIAFADSSSGASDADRRLSRGSNGGRWQVGTDRQWTSGHQQMGGRTAGTAGDFGRMPFAKPSLSDIR